MIYICSLYIIYTNRFHLMVDKYYTNMDLSWGGYKNICTDQKVIFTDAEGGGEYHFLGGAYILISTEARSIIVLLHTCNLSYSVGTFLFFSFLSDSAEKLGQYRSRSPDSRSDFTFSLWSMVLTQWALEVRKKAKKVCSVFICGVVTKFSPINPYQ